MDEAFSYQLPNVIYATDDTIIDKSAPFTVEYNGLVGEESGLRYVTLHYECENVVIKASFRGLESALIAAEIGNRTLDEL
ncbi:hypothetical protein BGZ76_008030, partial [Entomortierella beljakovae]